MGNTFHITVRYFIKRLRHPCSRSTVKSSAQHVQSLTEQSLTLHPAPSSGQRLKDARGSFHEGVRGLSGRDMQARFMVEAFAG